MDIESWNKVTALYDVPARFYTVPDSAQEGKFVDEAALVLGNRPKRRKFESGRKHIRKTTSKPTRKPKHEPFEGDNASKNWPSPARTDESSSLESLLEERALTIVNCFNRRDYEYPINAWASDDYVQSFPLANGRTLDLDAREAVRLMLEPVGDTPAVAEVLNISCNIDEKLGYAIVWLSLLSRGDWLGESVSVYSWRREWDDDGNKNWVWFRHERSIPVPSVPF